jgi:hypothetical protein
MGKDKDDDILKLVTEIVSAYVSKNPVPAHELPAIIKNVHATLGGFAGADERALPRAPAVAVRKSVQPDYLVCLEDGKKLKMLKRYLALALQAFAQRISRALEPAVRLSHGGAQLRPKAQRLRQEDRPGKRRRPQGKEEKKLDRSSEPPLKATFSSG